MSDTPVPDPTGPDPATARVAPAAREQAPDVSGAAAWRPESVGVPEVTAVERGAAGGDEELSARDERVVPGGATDVDEDAAAVEPPD